jgi:hypothetical protein
MSCKRLTEVAFKLLNPGGTLVFANFARGIRDDGYLETFMDWQLLYRDENEMAAIWSELPDREVASRRLFRDTNKNVIYALAQIPLNPGRIRRERRSLRIRQV